MLDVPAAAVPAPAPAPPVAAPPVSVRVPAVGEPLPALPETVPPGSSLEAPPLAEQAPSATAPGQSALASQKERTSRRESIFQQLADQRNLATGIGSIFWSASVRRAAATAGDTDFSLEYRANATWLLATRSRC